VLQNQVREANLAFFSCFLVVCLMNETLKNMCGYFSFSFKLVCFMVMFFFCLYECCGVMRWRFGSAGHAFLQVYFRFLDAWAFYFFSKVSVQPRWLFFHVVILYFHQYHPSMVLWLFSTLGTRNYEGVHVYNVERILSCWSCIIFQTLILVSFFKFLV